MKTIVIRAKQLVQVEKTPREQVSGKEMARIESIPDAFLLADGGKIVAFGPMSECPPLAGGNVRVIDASGRLVLPAFCDPHTHLVYAGSREIEYTSKIKGLSYEEIALRGGGILNTVKHVRAATEEELYKTALERTREIAGQGTGAVEIKSGYG
ncbi:MAG: amidohydrolase family protein, partial [Odoribacteraceae bacterium]|nr:amidohydrolase family protein [Odoribacteraceae bacterium]